jgi:pimeloyl-ACP methyl ester carboxylesterase
MANGGYPWWRRWSPLQHRTASGIRPGMVKSKEFVWSGRYARCASDCRGRAGSSHRKEAKGTHCHLVGHSHGGNVALVAANKLPPNTKSPLILLAGSEHSSCSTAEEDSRMVVLGRCGRSRAANTGAVSSPQTSFKCGGSCGCYHAIPSRSRVSAGSQVLCGVGVECYSPRRGALERKLAAHRALHFRKHGAVAGSLLNARASARR